jgi:hypothetical protein
MEVGSGNYKKQSPTKKNLAINDAVDFVLVCDTHYSLVNASSQRDERALARIHATNSNHLLAIVRPYKNFELRHASLP